MNDKELDVMEKILRCKHVTAISSEKALELIADVRRLKENEEKYIGQLTWIKDNFTAELKINEKYVIESIEQLIGNKKGTHIVDRMKQNLVSGENELIKLREENQRYKQSLKFYADSNNYSSATAHNGQDVIADNGEIANKALEVDTNE